MEITKVLQYYPSTKSEFAFLDKEIYQFTIIDTPSANLPWRSLEVSLKNVTYAIVDAVLYIKGTRIYYYEFHHIFHRAVVYGNRLVYTLNEDRNKNLETPFTPGDVYIKRWWRKNKKIQGFDFTQTGLPDDKWFKLKLEEPYEIAISSFKLIEKYHE